MKMVYICVLELHYEAGVCDVSFASHVGRVFSVMPWLGLARNLNLNTRK